ncbi:MAG: hypothetical protein RBR71_12845 [Gudongella sp.]|nr:hypothetical protein [Gudongella sp.]
MKKHILSKYKTSINKMRSSENSLYSEKTCETRSLEISDPDEFKYLGPTKDTFTKEDSDPDEFMMEGPTILTETIETSDPDEFYQTINGSRNDFALDADFDEFL